jgi:CYTH domain-containing protein
MTSRRNIEIEHKFLVVSDAWRGLVQGVHYRQGYLSKTGGVTVRVRAGGGTGYVTIKGRRTGYARPEFEYEIPVDDANTMIDTLARGRVVQKTRYRILHRDLIWEVDEFHGANAGLVIAEVELEDEAQPFEKPEWVGDDVTLDNRYANSRLAIEPYREWREKGQ